MKEEMIEHRGVLTAVADGSGRVLIEQASACSQCHAKSMCMAADSKEKEVDVVLAEPLQVGDRVIVYGSSSLGMKAVLLAYVLPFVLLVAIVLLLGQVVNNEAIVGTVALLSLIPYLILLKIFSKRLNRKFVFYAKKQ